MSVIAISIVGIILNAWCLRDSGIGPITWCIFPYLLAGGISLAVKEQPWPDVLLGAVVLMLVIDGGFFIETAAGTKSTFLLILSIVSTLKLLTAFPVGAIIGYQLHRILRSKAGLITHHQ